MDNWTIVLICFGAFLFLYFIYGLLLPRKWEIKESILINADQETLYNYLNHIRNWEKWTNWNSESKANYKFVYEGPESGEGAMQKWSVKRRSGKTTFTGGTEPSRIEFQFTFGQDKQRMDGLLELTPGDEGIRVDWSLKGDAGDNPSQKMTAKMMKPYMSKDFRAGLDRLQKITKSWEA